MFLLGNLAIQCYSPVVGKVAFKINMLIIAATISGLYAQRRGKECRGSAAVKPMTREQVIGGKIHFGCWLME
jgi:hypothetical protein